jgi:hypothetical protein
MTLRLASECLVLLFFVHIAGATDINALTTADLHAAFRNAKPGDHIQLGAGPYKGGFFVTGLAGAPGKPIRVSGPSRENPAVFADEKNTIFQFVAASYIEIENIHITKAGGHGLALDDGGKNDFSCHHIVVRNVRIEDIGPKGTMCSMKLAGVSDFTIADSTFQKWGDGGGCGVDGVGCKNGSLEHCNFLPGRGSVAIQFKGGSDSIAIGNCLVDDAGSIGINVGGASGMQFFRPKPMGFEARNITIEGNTFIGTDSPIVFPNTDGAVVRFNTIYLPKKWAFRILQETVREDFTPSRNGHIENNIIVFNSRNWYEGGVNVGPGTAPQTFTFTGNVWYCVDNPAKSTPHLPAAEKDALIGRDPLFVDPSHHDFSLQPSSPARGKGHTAFQIRPVHPEP